AGVERKETTMIPTNHTQQPTATMRLRLTRRGRAVFGTLAVLLALTVLALGAMFGAQQAQATSEPAPESVFEYVVAGPGDTLWSIAGQVAPDADPRVVIDDM